MFGLEYLLALMKIFINIAFAIITAIPFWICWNCIAPTYLYFLPEVYQTTGYWEMVGILLVLTFIGEQIQKLTPTFISVSQTNKSD